ncbi:puromycin-sensitive aminopeptidase-like isoform X2 [Leptotrombidium deliense]|uniref:Aminopeptidase n=1 Tax=Leptotrombidium deliense TaxID=299467 RepID=A0A443SF08_9ACAR|nr:puromycin-sensitive aminopeptidase-like isoform X2 [Leptotrombidium deliense]
MNVAYFVTLVFSLNLICKSLAESGCGKLTNFQLPRSVIPEHYDLTLRPDLNSRTFTGSENILVTLIKESSEITLHSRELNILSAVFISSNSADALHCEVNYCKDEQTVTFQLPQRVIGSGTLSIEFTGKLNNQAVGGFYASKYYAGNTSRYEAVTQFEPMGARRAIPCFDEPNMKATFSASLIVPNDRVALSNMPQISNTSVSETESKISFSKSPRMSTYLLAFAVGEYEFLERYTSDGKVKIRAYTPLGEKEKGSFALDTAVRAVDYFQEYFGVEYPLPKLDLIAISEFDAGAMENWGLITYKQVLLVMDTKTASLKQRQSVAYVTVHEVAHQWFGNLVTMDWWSQIWLNEGFAAFMHTFGTGRLFPGWNFGNRFLVNDYEHSLYADSLSNSHAIEMHITDPSRLYELFDTITYSKGASIIRMLVEWIGEEDFKRGLTLYFNRFKYKNTKSDDLWTALADISHKPVKDVMSTWILQKGYPYLKVIVENNSLFITQSHFTLNQTLKDPKKLWKIPIIFSVGNEKRKTLIIFDKSAKIDIPVSEAEALHNLSVNFNLGAVGFYRTQYTREMYENMFTRIKNKEIEAKDRFSIINDLFAFSTTNIESSVYYLKFLDAFQGEDELFIWQAIANSLSEFNMILSHIGCEEYFKKYNRNLMRNAYTKSSLKAATDENSGSLYSLLYARLGVAGDESIVQNATQQFEKAHAKALTINPNHKMSVYTVVASSSSPEIFNKLLDLYKQNKNNPSERSVLSNVLGLTNDEKLLDEVLKFSITNDVGVSDTVSILDSVCHSPIGRQKAWKFFTRNFELFKKRYEGGIEVTRLIRGITSSFTTFEKADEIDAFFKDNDLSGIESTLKNSLEMVRMRADWLRRDAADVCDYLKKVTQDL